MQAIRDVAPDFVAGVAAGSLVVDPLGLEAFAHQSLAHRNQVLHPALENIARYSLLMVAFQPNQFGVEHRVHHREEDTEPEGIGGTVSRIAEKGSGGYDPNTNPDAMQFPGYTDFDDDPLIQEAEDGTLEFRNNPMLERFMNKGKGNRFLPFLGGIMAVAAANRLAGRKRPLARAAAFMGGALLSASAPNVVTTYGETRAGFHGSTMDIDNGPWLLRPNMRRHNEHHQVPWDPSVGEKSVRARVIRKALTKVGLIHPIPNPGEPEES